MLHGARSALQGGKGPFVADCPVYRSEAVRIPNGVVDSVVIAEPVNFSQTMPICGSSENAIATAVFGLTK